jgi:dimethylhistidine N-methyltransferase
LFLIQDGSGTIHSTIKPSAAKSPDSEARRAFLNDVRDGLRRSSKQLPCKYFYDERGSILFDRICELDEYYLTRAELELMERFAPEMGARLGPGVMLVEYGSGSSVKTRHLLDGLTEPAAYVPVDISGEHLRKTAIELAHDYPAIEVRPIPADFTKPFALPRTARAPARVAVYFPGSTIGNFLPDQAAALLRRIVDLCGPGGGLLIGVDLKKDASRLEAAYDDSLGVTAEFNRNLLVRINRELGADFDPAGFAHRARYNQDLGRVEIDLVSREPQIVHLGGETIEFAEGEAIRTEYSHKYTAAEFSAIAEHAGLTLDREWTDEGRNFAVLYYSVAG